MNRVLSWPDTLIGPDLLDASRSRRRRRTIVTERGTVRLDLPRGFVEMKFSAQQSQLPAGTAVYVWWKGGGFVCAPSAEVEAQERESRSIAERLLQARVRLADARRVRSAWTAANIDIVLPIEGQPASEVVAA